MVLGCCCPDVEDVEVGDCNPFTHLICIIQGHFEVFQINSSVPKMQETWDSG